MVKGVVTIVVFEQLVHSVTEKISLVLFKNKSIYPCINGYTDYRLTEISKSLKPWSVMNLYIWHLASGNELSMGGEKRLLGNRYWKTINVWGSALKKD